ncbi:MAG: hypothetical protein ACTSW7_00955 [Candidatus Thorarchaeota archaeon]|nr:MAG: hypothetical protein DRQ25_04775 [Candidatus Fermentibacteria bacterium]HEC72055.1 hypothetical protein [Thermoplasmatales archaeon]
MGNHKHVKVRNNEAAIVFTNDRGFDIVTGYGPLLILKMAQAFAVCYAVTTHEHLFDAFRRIIISDMQIRKHHSTDVKERMQRQQMIDLLSDGLEEFEDKGGEEDGDGEDGPTEET